MEPVFEVVGEAEDGMEAIEFGEHGDVVSSLTYVDYRIFLHTYGRNPRKR